jgi:hypothetical protein
MTFYRIQYISLWYNVDVRQGKQESEMPKYYTISELEQVAEKAKLEEMGKNIRFESDVYFVKLEEVERLAALCKTHGLDIRDFDVYDLLDNIASDVSLAFARYVKCGDMVLADCSLDDYNADEIVYTGAYNSTVRVAAHSLQLYFKVRLYLTDTVDVSVESWIGEWDEDKLEYYGIDIGAFGEARIN